MAVRESWFPKELHEGNKVSLDKPTPSQWVIGKPVNTHSYQADEMHYDSYVCAQFECHNVTDGKKGFMRIYVQVPHTGYDHAARATLAREATELTPPELDAYKFLTANRSQNTPTLLAYKRGTQPIDGPAPGGPVPGGHITWIVWEKVPGKYLGHPKSAFVYWDMPSDERKLVREAFLREFPKIMKMGYFPEKPSPSSLIWDKDTDYLYFVGFRDSMPFKANERSGKPHEAWLPNFDLARPPQKNYKWKKDYKGNMEGWKL
ncbi:hypothetical protein PENSOL_c056G01400 [Penicillium solitum]|uniref:Uncharacterized protein n=1 Tax=Penicillium solitum TaxID=60172 RepID=A0A1V6QQP4_9EURO|nr:uncharacterized protein PENSOL_c056G01400 [Penicillium solitum]OQD91262.1 hypothetical protein PENSOL_c056G01400 [Penicillium solitum]